MAKILIVEDDPIIARMYEQAFSFTDHEVNVAGDGEEGLAKIKSDPPTIVLLDVMMPKMNGWQMLEKLKLEPAIQHIPVIMLTNLSERRDAEAALDRGAVKYIIKGEHTPKEVLDMVEEIIAAYSRHELPRSTDDQA